MVAQLPKSQQDHPLIQFYLSPDGIRMETKVLQPNLIIKYRYREDGRIKLIFTRRGGILIAYSFWNNRVKGIGLAKIKYANGKINFLGYDNRIEIIIT